MACAFHCRVDGWDKSMNLLGVLDTLSAAIWLVASWDVLLVIIVSAAYGIIVGAIPGLTATMAVALIVPMTFYLSDVQAIAAIVTSVTCSIFAGDIPAILVRIPGTPASAAYAADGYALSQRGQHVLAISISMWFSVVGGLFGTLVLATMAPMLARVAVQFTSYEYFWLYVLGLTCAVIVSDKSLWKGTFALLLGLLLSTVGLGTDFSVPRLTFGNDELITGISFIPAMIGLFGISEVLRNVLTVDGNSTDPLSSPVAESIGQVFRSQVRPLLWMRKFHLLRSSAIGAFIGMLPGAGADIAAWISYAVSKRFSRKPEEYGHGSLEGMGDATGANNAALGGAWIPALVFGIPGDSVTAIAIGVLMMKNITPGPKIFDSAADPHQSALVTSIYLVFILANLALIPLGMLSIYAGGYLVRIPRRVLLPLIVVFCTVGSYAMSASYFDVWVMLIMGIVGFFLERWKFPLGAIVLGLIMGGPLEHRLMQCLSKSSEWTSFFASPISLSLGLVCVLLWVLPILLPKRSIVPIQQV
jgi:putative tricarboxylic transport membrane protein